MNSDQQKIIELEMIYEPFSSLGSCLEPHLASINDERSCRRAKNHKGVHASGFGHGFIYWERYEDAIQGRNEEKRTDPGIPNR